MEWVWSLCPGRHKYINVLYMLIHVYSSVCYHVQGGSGSVSVYTNPISQSFVMASL